MKLSTLIQISALALATTLPAMGQAQEAKPDMADGEIRKVDLSSKKITIRHGEIKNLDMPAMTMVFQVKDLSMLEQVKAGDQVKFSAEKIGGAMVVTEIQRSK